MNVSGIRPNQGFYQYNSIRLNELRNQQIAASSANLSDSASKEQQNKELEIEQAAIASKQNFDSYDFAQQYRPNEEYELKGSDSNLSNLDTAKAVSELGKDQILQQYQYFVGKETTADAKPAPVETRAQENFFL